MPHPFEAEHEALEDDARMTFLESRTILPGAQTVFGFQLSVLFTATFQEKLDPADRYVHFLALALNAATIAVLIFPAAYHRQVTPGVMSRNFIRLTNRAMQVALALLACSMGSTMYIVSHIVFASWIAGTVGAIVTFALFLLLWFVWPRWARRHRTTQEVRAENEEPKDK